MRLSDVLSGSVKDEVSWQKDDGFIGIVVDKESY